MLRKILNFILSLFGVKPWDPTKNPIQSKGVGTSKSPYIDYANDFVIPLPGSADGTIMYCFPIEADYQKLTEVCNTHFNAGLKNEPLRYFPLTKYLILVMSNFKKGYTLDKSYPKSGYVNETAVQIFMPVAECKLNGDKEWVAERIVVAVPYIFVDNPFSMVAGREELGFPKCIAKFKFPSSPSKANKFITNVYGIQKFDKINPQTAEYFPWLNINKMTDEEISEQESWKSRKEAWGNVKETFERIPKDKDFVEGLPFFIHELEDLTSGDIPMVFLKQFRDAEIPENACYQAMIEGNGFLKEFLGGGFLGGEYELKFEDFDSYPVKENLGLQDKIVVKHSFWIKANLMFTTGKEIWRTA